jgi:pimeloyl-ACP methyl ester carboxylesterase
LPIVTTPDLIVHYRHAGHGDQTLVLLHGNYASSRWWVPQLDRLSKRVQVYAPDLRGCGGKEARTLCQRRVSRLTLDDLVDDLAQFVNALHLTNSILVGHSLGGVIAIEYALAHPDRLQGLVLVDTAPPEGLSLAASLARPLAVPLGFGNRMLMQRALRQVGLPRRGQLAYDLVSDALSTDPNQYVAFSEALKGWSVEAALPSLHAPTLLIWGQNDKIMPGHIGKRYLDLLPLAQMVTLPGAGHSPQIEQPDEFAAILLGWVAGLGTSMTQSQRATQLSFRERVLIGITHQISNITQRR